MALEKSVLDVDKVRELLITEYGLHLIGLYPLSLGTANCFKVCCNEGVYFFKEYPGSFTVPMVEKEVRLVEYLFSKGYPVARFIDTLNGSCCILFSSHVIGVQEFVEGKTYLNDLPHPLLKESAKYLGILHFLLKDYPMESGMDEKWVESYSPKTAAERYDRLLDTLEESRSDPNYHRIREDLLFKRELSGQIEDMKTYYTGITYTPSHGDYTACQFICGEGSVKAVIDFSSAAALPTVWEIMRSYIQSCGACRGGTAFDIEDFVLYVKEYDVGVKSSLMSAPLL